MRECVIPNARSPFMQGDLFLRKEWTDRDPWDRLGVIITADCDIARKKYPGFLSFVPVITLQDYIRDVWAPKRLAQEYKNKTILPLQQLVLILSQRINPDALTMTEHVLIRWALRTSTDDIVSTLGAANQKDIARLTALLDAVKMMHQSESPYSKLIRICALNDEKRKPLPVYVDKVRKDFRSFLSRLPQDVFFVGEIPDLPAAFPNQMGFFAMLAHIRPLPDYDLTESISAARDMAEAAVRIGRLNEHYKFALSQGFAHLFSKIGMPLEYEEDRDMIFDDFCESLEIGEC